MRLPTSHKPFLIAGGVILALLIGFVVREQVLRMQARRLPSYAADLVPEKRTALEAKVAQYEAAMRANPNDFNAYVEVALAKTDLGDRESAGEVYRMMNQRFPGNYLSFQNLGQLYEGAGNFPMAAEQYLLAIQNAPKNPHVYRYLVNLYTYHLTERASDIPRVLQQGLAQVPGSIDFMTMLGVYYRDHGQPEEAIRWFEHLLVFDETNTVVLEEVKALKAQLRK